MKGGVNMLKNEIRVLAAAFASETPVEITFEVDERGDGQWRSLATFALDKSRRWLDLSTAVRNCEWTRVRANADLRDATCFFLCAQKDERAFERAAIFNGLATSEHCANMLGARMWTREDNRRLAVVSQIVVDGKVEEERYYELTEDATLERVPNRFEGGEQGTIQRVKEKVEPRELDASVYRVDDASALVQLNERR